MSKIKEGIFFYFFLKNEEIGIGQVVNIDKLKGVTIVVFDKIFKNANDIDVTHLSESNIILCLNTTIAFFKLKRFIPLRITGKSFNIFINKEYKIEDENGFFLINEEGVFLRRIKNEESSKYMYINSVSGAVIVNTANTYFGLIDKEDYYTGKLLKS